jgi:parvulin-like peptidyl-prolyl isomerase
VDGEPIVDREVLRQAARALGDRQLDPAELEIVRAGALEQLVDRRLVLQYLARTKAGPSEADLQLAREQVEEQLAQQQTSFAEFLHQGGLSEDEFRRHLAWQVGWRQYLERYLTDQNLERFFIQRRRHYDGSQVRAAHLLLKVEPPGDAAALAAAREQAAGIRREIAAGKLTFAQAVERRSDAPTRGAGGGLGWIARREPMPESFSRAAFELEPGQVSEPVTTAFGVHLIQCLEVKPGHKTWRDVHDELERDASLFLFQWAAAQQRPLAKVEFTGAMPYFKPGTRELVRGKP